MISGKILFIGGSLNQTSMMHKISEYFPDYECWFSPYYGDGYIKFLTNTGMLDFSILGGQFRKHTLDYLLQNSLKIDECGIKNNYDLIFTCSDLIVPKNILRTKVILVQEGMTDPENIPFKLVKYLRLPRYFASTAATGLSDLYHNFCVASEGYKKLFIRKGIKEEKIAVTGIPNFDDCKSFLNNDFPHRNYVLIATSDSRETFKYENRKQFICEAVKIAAGRSLIFKLHPNENINRAVAEIHRYAPGSLIFASGNTGHMVANCDILITRYSSVVYVGLALGKQVFSEYNIDELKELLPEQNGGKSAYNISQVARQLLKKPAPQKESDYRKNIKRKLLRKRISKFK